MIIDADKLRQECADFGVEVDSLAAERLDKYADLLIEWNKRMNLTGITEPSGIVTRHFADSASFFAAVTPRDGASIIDVGSGAGFPGMVIKILRPDMAVTLLDATNKRITFLQAVADELGIALNAVHGRAEEIASKAEYREAFDYATARAVAELRVLSEYCLGFVKMGGEFVAMKGQLGGDEISSAQSAILTMGGKSGKITRLVLADGSERQLMTVKKISHTPTKYPRKSSRIKQKPL